MAAKKRKMDIRTFFTKSQSANEAVQPGKSSTEAGGATGSQVNEAMQPGASSSTDTGEAGRAVGLHARKDVDSNSDSSSDSESGSDGSSEDQCSSEDVNVMDIVENKPNQPDPKYIEVQRLSNKVLHFQDSWYKQYPWLHYSPSLKRVLCFQCVKAYNIKKCTLEKKADTAFSSKGFNNWKNALVSFDRHQCSKSHHHAVTVNAQEARPIDAQLSSVWAKKQKEARHCLEKIVGSVQYLARQGGAFRGHEANDGNVFHLLKFIGKDDPTLSTWLSRCHDYASPQAQNEFLNLLGNTIVRDIATSIRSLPVLQYSIIIDGTQDVAGKEQESVCFRYVDHDLVPHELFIGLYAVSGTTGEEIAKVAVDVLLRLNLPMSGLRGQTYDGAANMAGKYTGAQAVLKRQQPLALYVHCGAHCLNLITQSACTASPLIRDSLQWVHELGNLSNQSGKFKAMFEVKAGSEGHHTTLKPLCPTRWTVRGKAVNSVLCQYDSVLSSLEEMASNGSDTGVRANGLLDRFQKGKTVLGLLLASEVIGELECLNKSLQKQTQTIAGMQAAIEYVKSTLQGKRNKESFQDVFDKAVAMVDSLGIEPIQMPHQRQPPKWYTGRASQHAPKSPEEYYRIEFYKMLDTVDLQFTERFNQTDLQILLKLEKVLLTGEMDEVVDQYPELNRESLKVQLPMFLSNNTYKSSAQAADILRGMSVEVRGLFDQVEALVRLLLVIPVSSAEAERSFSTLRRLKTWLRSTMSQMRLNNAAVCHVHQDKLDLIDLRAICQQFVSVNDRRRHVFGSFT